MEFEITYLFNRPDFLSLNEEIRLKRKSSNRYKFIPYLLNRLVPFLCGILLILIYSLGIDKIKSLLIGLFFVGYSIFYKKLFSLFASYKNGKLYDSMKHFSYPIVVHLDESNIKSKSKIISAETQWIHLTECLITNKFILLFVNPLSFIAIPKNSLSIEQHEWLMNNISSIKKL